MSGKLKMEARLREIGLPSGEAKGSTMIEKWDNYLEKFSNLIEEDYKENRERREDFEEKMEILEEIEGYLAKNVLNQPIEGIEYDLKAVVPFGSSASGLGMKGGDLDMIVCVHPALGRRKKLIAHERSNDILSVIYQHIKKRKLLGDREVTEMEHRSGARVPIVTLSVDGVDVDISISMTCTVSAQYLSAKFIDAYERYDRRFIVLAAFVKKWQKSMKTDKNENYHRQVFPNSCSTVLLVVLFMKHYGMLPNINKLHRDKLGKTSSTWRMVRQGENGAFGIPREDVLKWKESFSYDVNLGTLFLLFLDFYGNIVDLKADKLVIGEGTVRPKRRNMSKNRIFIADVIDGDNPAKSVIEIGEFKEFLREAMEIIRDGGSPKSMKEELLNMEFEEPKMTKKRLNRLRALGVYMP